jgi:NAD(P) transhydrogenase subunit alpha
MSKEVIIAKQAQILSEDAYKLSEKINELIAAQSNINNSGIDPFIFALTIFVLSCFIGYYVVWKVTPALHTPLMSVTNAISGIVIIGAMIAVGPESFGLGQFLGLIAVIIASINIFGGFIVTNRMLEMFKKK